MLRALLIVGGRSCRGSLVWITGLAVFSAVAFGAAPFFLSSWVNALARTPVDPVWVWSLCGYFAAYAAAFLSRDVQWWLYTRLESAVLGAVTQRLTLRLIHAAGPPSGVGLLAQTLDGAQSLLFCSLFILMPAVLEALGLVVAIAGTAPAWMAVPLLLHTAGFLYLIDYGTGRVALHQRRLNPHAARVLDLAAILCDERRLLQRYSHCSVTDAILASPLQARETERVAMGWTRTWTTTLVNVWSLIGLGANLALALWFYHQGTMTVGNVVAVESVFFLVLRRLEMWSRGYRETGQAIEQSRDGLMLLTTEERARAGTATADRFRNGCWNVLSGRTGVGKSTWLFKRWVQSGRQAGLLPQDAEVLPGTIRFNLTLGTDSLSDALAELLRELELDGTIARLPDGLDTELSPGQSLPLSGGEVQRLCLVRVLLHWRGTELLLDEPTAAQSEAEERRVLQVLKQRTNGRTVWIVSHRPAVLEWAEQRWECTGWDCVESRST